MNLKWPLLALAMLTLLIVDWVLDGVGPRLVFGTGTLVVQTTPLGAAVKVNGVALGAAPLDAAVRPGAAVVEAHHPYHPPATQRLTITRGERRTVSFALEPASGQLEIATNPRGAAVTINGERLPQQSPVSLESVRTGRHQVEVSMHGRHAVSDWVEVFPNRKTSKTFELERAPMGQLSLQLTPPHATVELVDADVSWRLGEDLPAGTHRLRVSAAGFETREATVRVAQGRNLAQVTLPRIYGALRLDVEPPSADVRVTFQAADGSRTVPYEAGMQLPSGGFSVRATAMGHRNLRRNLTMTSAGVRLRLAMQRYDIAPGRQFRDALKSGGEGPLLVVVGPGTFRMGSSQGASNERPEREVRVTQPFAIGVFEVTQADFSRHQTWPGEPDEPAVGLTLRDLTGYLAFLSRETGYGYRLPSEAEWEYAARAGGQEPFMLGAADEACAYGNVRDLTMQERYRDYDVTPCADGFAGLAPVGRFAANAFGLHDVLGNAEEWVADCWHSSFAGAPRHAGVWSDGCDFSGRVARGTAFDSPPTDLRITFRNVGNSPSDSRGFRVAREL